MRIFFDDRVILESPYDAARCQEAAGILRERAGEMASFVLVGAYIAGVPGWNDSSYALTTRRVIELAEMIEGLAKGDEG